MKNSTTLCIGLAAAFILASELALAQVYTWKDPATGQSRFSNIAPPWYNRGEAVSGPRVVATVGERVIDDTALAYEDRLLLSGKSKDAVDKLRLPKIQTPAAAQPPNHEPAGTRAAGGRPADKTVAGGEAAKNQGS